jgi:hypothetical protein
VLIWRHRDGQDASRHRARYRGRDRHGKRVRFYSTVELVNTLEQEKASSRAGRLALPFHVLSKLHEHTNVIITTNLVFAE